MNLDQLKLFLNDSLIYYKKEAISDNNNPYDLLEFIEQITTQINNLSPLTDLAQEQYTWIENTTPHWHNKTVLECLALIASEVGEAINEARGLEVTDDFKYELVDIILRVLDLSYQLNIDLDTTINEKMLANKNRDFSKKLK